MQLSDAAQIKQFWTACQRRLFPVLAEELGVLTEKHQALAAAFCVLDLADADAGHSGATGRPPHDRLAILRAFLAKSRLNLSTTRQLLDRLHTDATLRRLCGWERAQALPSESVFSRAFAQWAGSGMLEQVQEKLVAQVYQDRLVGHVIRDASAIPAREKPAKKQPAPVQQKRRRGRPRKDHPPQLKSRLERQPSMSIPEMVADLPKVCDRGVKIGSDGKKQRWTGYKLHWDISDNLIPLSCLVTSASLHDSQAALPLAATTAQRVTACYELMDKGYHSEALLSKLAVNGAFWTVQVADSVDAAARREVQVPCGARMLSQLQPAGGGWPVLCSNTPKQGTWGPSGPFWSRQPPLESAACCPNRFVQKPNLDNSDSEDIQKYCEGLGRVVLIPDVERQGKPALPMAPAAKKRYELRGMIEQLTARLKDEFGGRHIRVRGWRKVLAHLMLGVLMLSVDQLLRLVT